MIKLDKIISTGIILVFCTTISFGQNKPIKNVELIQQIDSLFKADQECVNIKPADSAAAKYQRVIKTNFPLVEAILTKYGFPGYDIVGKKGANNYFLLVQHSDFNLDFQKKALNLMKIQVDKKNAPGTTYAFLVDRIEINSGRKQIYGTQVDMGRDGTKIKPCVDVANLDERRKSVGLKPIKEYLDQCDEVFKQMNPTETKKQD